MYQVRMIKAAEKQLKCLPARIQLAVAETLVTLRDIPRPAGCKKIKGHNDTWRVRCGDYRIVYEVRDDVLLVIVIRLGHRKEVYRGL